ncbi:restriction endonuclease subunit S [Hoeflea alexandrii]|uniref:Restriction endonuclease subunit S n=1 Tax=Hoeflea alexandrii TaxID=288436 RepID=A0ABT1CKQ8_9HYPH|nr:restriction endonuclease subunit S [Hoeflea alexandrii]MCO6406780.1 restriction endonuclease subunit S [Hoeflea alexandrii]MCY0154745.1 restriction endonuclease subunit S [Hoeflea alexandrii]
MSRELPWERLGNLATVKAGATPARKNGDRFYIGGTINWVKTGDLNNGRLYATEERVTEEAVNETSLSVHPPGTVLVAMYGGLQQIGRSALLECPATTNQAISALIPDRNKMLGEFLNYCLVSLRPNWRKVAASSRKDPNITKQDVLDFQVPVPPLHEQRRIAEILSSVDGAIAATRSVIEQTKKVKQGVLERLLTKGIGHTRFKQTEIGEIPEGWPLTSVDNVCTQVSVGIVIKPSQYYVENGVRCFRSANVREGFVEDADWVYISEEGNRANRKSVLRTGDVLVVRTGYPGTSCVVPPRYDGANCIDIIFARPKNELADPYFLSTFINSASGKTQVLKAEGGLAQKHFNVGAMKQMKLPLPPLNEQQEIVAHVQEFASTEAALQRNLEQQMGFKSALMSDLLTGRKRMPDTVPMAAE